MDSSISTLPPTRKLYWADAYRRHFRAQVLAQFTRDQPGVILNRTLFYPTGGGQPHDLGDLGTAKVVAVEEWEHLIIHWLDRAPTSATEIPGSIDWRRRWDHMQQHSGQHVLSAALYTLLNRPTVGFHLSDSTVTIDVPGMVPTAAEMARVSDHVANIIHADLPIQARLATPSEARRLPLRKPPPTKGVIRIVEIPGIDLIPCGGTHVHSTAAIGAMAILKWERRSETTRVYFACGHRATMDHRQRLLVTQTLTSQLTTSLEDLTTAVSRLQFEATDNQRQVQKLLTKLAEDQAARLWSSATMIGDTRIISAILDGSDPKVLQRTVSQLSTYSDWVAILATETNQRRWLVSGAQNIPLDLRTLLPAMRAIPGIQGGGQSDLIQGGATDRDSLEAFIRSAKEIVSAHFQPSSATSPATEVTNL